MVGSCSLLSEWAGNIRRDLVDGLANEHRAELSSANVAGVPTIEVGTYAGLVRVVGYIKYHSQAQVFLRGQPRAYGSMLPGAYRGSAAGVDEDIDAFLHHFQHAIGIDRLPEHKASTEALLQHYGVRTRWLDVVDSIPHALYFAVYDFVVSRSGSLRITVPSDDDAFLYLLQCGSTKAMKPVRATLGQLAGECDGIWESDSGLQLADLRRAKPSNWLRPHAQHGYLIRPAPAVRDLWPLVLAQIRLPRRRARSWIAGACFRSPAMFPGPASDLGFRSLLQPRVASAFAAWRALGRDYDPGGIARYSPLGR